MKIDNALTKPTRQKINVRLTLADPSGSSDRMCSIKKVFLKNSRNSQENTSAKVGVNQLELVNT